MSEQTGLKTKRFATALALALMLACSLALAAAVHHERAFALSTPSNSGALVVDNGKLTSTKTGKAVVLRGVSLHGLAWFPQYVNTKAFKTLRRTWKANVVRLPLYTAEYGGYCTGGDKARLRELVDKGVQCAVKNDMYVIIDWHTLSDKNPGSHLSAAKKFFSTMAKKYRGNKNVIYEICNEPNGSTSWAQVKKYASKIIPTIRKHDKDAVILVGTPEWCQRVDQAAASPLPERLSHNVMYTFHFYAATHKADMRKRLQSALDKGLPVFVSEYGLSEASGSGKINKSQARAWMKLLSKYKVSSCAWNLSNKRESSAMIKPGFAKAFGFKYKNLTKNGKWVYTALRKAKW